MDARYARILIGIASAIVVLLIAIVVIVVTGGDDEQQAATTSTISPPQTTTATTEAPATSEPTASTEATTTTAAPTTTATTTTAATTTTSTTTTAPPPSGACSGLPEIPIGAGATDQTVAWGDVDGDGQDDTVVVYREAGSWWMNVELDYGWSTEIPMAAGMVARAINVVNMGVGEEVIVAQIDVGASAEIIGFFGFQSCGIFHATDGNTGFETAFALGGSVTHLDGLICTADGIKVMSSAQDPGDPALWEYTETDYLWVPGLGEMQPLASSIALLTSPDDDATIYGASDFGC